MTKLYNLANDPDTGEEDLHQTFNNAVYSLRMLVEKDGQEWEESVQYVASKMHLTYQEFDKLYEGAKKKFSE